MRTAFRAAMILSLGAVAGCFVDVDFGGGPYRCTREAVCDEGFECRGGECVALGTPHDAAPIDAAIAPLVPAFGTPVANLELSDPLAGDDDATFTADRLVVVLASGRGGGGDDLFTSARTSVTDAWPAPVLDTVLSSADNETTTAISADGLSLIFGSNRAGGAGGSDIYLSTRASRAAAWTVPVNVSSLNTAADDLAGWISDDGSTVILHSNLGGNFDIYTASRNGAGGYDAPQPVSELNSAEQDSSARFALGGLVITFSSSRPGGLGNVDAYAATRATLDEPFGPVTPIAGISTPGGDDDIWLSDDLCHLAYSTLDALGERQIFEAECLP